MKTKILFTLLAMSFSLQAQALQSKKSAEACYTLQGADIATATLQVPREVCFQRLYLDLNEKIALASSLKTPALMTDFAITKLNPRQGLGYYFELSSELLVVTLQNCEKTESVHLYVTGETNEYGETNPTVFNVTVKHSLQDNLCDVQDVKNVYQYVLKK